jgi:hypothetical protein
VIIGTEQVSNRWQHKFGMREFIVTWLRIRVIFPVSSAEEGEML